MRMRGMPAPVKRAPVQEPKALKKKNIRVDPVTGMRYLNKSWYEEAIRPKMPTYALPKVETVVDLIKYWHLRLVRDWEKANGTTVTEVLRTYGRAVELGFKGHMGNWERNILAGGLVEGSVDLTPKKLSRRFL